ncbi:MAG: putative transposase/invertase (TIGR01784 family) [Aureispira sp.]|jgi:predicted transposase/invertase (TIGR01784 family)
MEKGKQLIRFDWAIKKLLRNKANFDILEGFLSELLGESIKIKQILDSESNKETEDDKHNRVDLLVEDSKGDLVIIEVQNSKEYDYFHRILYGTSKAITEYINAGEPYAKVKKVISVTIAYFDLGQGKDYIYHGKNEFKGVHQGDILNLADKQKELYRKNKVHEVFPEYWLIKVSQFNNAVQDKLDEWIYFLKNGEVQDSFTAKGLVEAKEKLDEMKLSKEERAEYKGFLKNLRDLASEQHTKMADAEDLIKKGEEKGIKKGIRKGIKKGKEEGKEEANTQAVLGLYENNIAINIISSSLQISEEKILEIIEKNKDTQ